MNEQGRNLVASVRQRLINLSQERGEDPNLIFIRYALERFLYRLSRSRQSSKFILKGARAERAAIIYSLVASCKVNGHDPFAYFRDVLEKISTWPANRIVMICCQAIGKNRKNQPTRLSHKFFAGVYLAVMLPSSFDFFCNSGLELQGNPNLVNGPVLGGWAMLPINWTPPAESTAPKLNPLPD